MAQPTIFPTNSWPDSDAGGVPTVATSIPETQPTEPVQRVGPPKLHSDGTMLSRPEAFAEAAAQQQQGDLSRLGYPQWVAEKASTRPSS
jgi:hypothetical protein